MSELEAAGPPVFELPELDFDAAGFDVDLFGEAADVSAGVLDVLAEDFAPGAEELDEAVLSEEAAAASFLLLRDCFVVAVVSVEAVLSDAEAELPDEASAAGFVLLSDFFVLLASELVDLSPVAAFLSVAEASVFASAAFLSAAAFSFLALLFDFLASLESVVVSVPVVEVDCVNAGALKIARVSERANIHRVILLWRRFIFPRKFLRGTRPQVNYWACQPNQVFVSFEWIHPDDPTVNQVEAKILQCTSPHPDYALFMHKFRAAEWCKRRGQSPACKRRSGCLPHASLHSALHRRRR